MYLLNMNTVFRMVIRKGVPSSSTAAKVKNFLVASTDDGQVFGFK
jgi:hypothetical protein